MPPRCHLSLIAVAALACLSACATAPAPRPAPALGPEALPFGDPARRDREAPLALDAITDTRSGALLTPAELAARLTGTRLVFVGETHTSPDAHRIEAQLIEALAATGRQVLVGLEMFPRDPAVDDALRGWSEGAIDEPTFLRRSRWYEHWGFNFGYYRPVFATARRLGVRMYGVNAPHPVIVAVRKKGFDGLTPEERKALPPRVDTSSDEQRRLFRALIAGGEGPHGGALPDAALEGMFRAQCTWDAVMAWNATRVLDAEGAPNAILVVLLGAGHVAFGLGAPRQAALAGASAVASVIAVPVPASPHVRASYADYLWAIPPEPDLPLFPTLGVSLAEGAEGRPPSVVAVTPGAAADRAGVQANDRLAAIDGAPIPDRETALRLIADKQWGDAVRLKIERGGGAALDLTALLRRQLP